MRYDGRPTICHSVLLSKTYEKVRTLSSNSTSSGGILSNHEQWFFLEMKTALKSHLLLGRIQDFATSEQLRSDRRSEPR